MYVIAVSQIRQLTQVVIREIQYMRRFCEQRQARWHHHRITLQLHISQNRAFVHIMFLVEVVHVVTGGVYHDTRRKFHAFLGDVKV